MKEAIHQVKFMLDGIPPGDDIECMAIDHDLNKWLRSTKESRKNKKNEYFTPYEEMFTKFLRQYTQLDEKIVARALEKLIEIDKAAFFEKYDDLEEVSNHPATNNVVNLDDFRNKTLH